MNKTDLTKVLQELTTQIQQLLGDKLTKIVLFGSYARGDNTEWSDVNILVLTNMSPQENKAIFHELNKIFSRLGLEYDILLSLCLIDKASYDSRKEFHPFYQNVEKEGVILYDTIKPSQFSNIKNNVLLTKMLYTPIIF